MDLPIPTIRADIGIIFQLKAVSFSSVIVVYTYAFKYALQCASSIRTAINLSANLLWELSNYFDLQQKLQLMKHILLYWISDTGKKHSCKMEDWRETQVSKV